MSRRHVVGQTKERLLGDLADVRYGLRTLGRSPGFALAASLSLALGIGANTAIFSLINLMVLKPLPVSDPRRLVQIAQAGEDGRFDGANYPWFREIAARTDLFSAVFAIRQNLFKVEVGGRLEPISGQFVTGSYYRALGVNAILGRTLLPEDQREGGINPVAVISHAYWQRRFGGDPDVLGQTIIVDRDPYTIVGVTPPEFFGLQVGTTIDVTVPLIATRYADPDAWFSMPIVARLKPGLGVDRVRAELDVVRKRFVAAHVSSEQLRRQYLQRAELPSVANGLGALRREFLEPLRLLMGAVGILLLIACVNLAGLLVARNATRQRELGIRLSLGASRSRILRQLLTESALLAALGAVLGVLFAFWGSNLLLGFLMEDRGPTTLSAVPDLRVLGFALAATTMTTFLFGLVPAYRATRTKLLPTLSVGSRQLGPLRTGLGRGLVIAQFALSLLLVAAALLFIRSLMNLSRFDAGFARGRVLIVTIDAPGTAYEGEKLRLFQREMLVYLRRLPGVLHATIATSTPLNDNHSTRRISVHGVTPRGEGDIATEVNAVGPDYFDTLKIPVLRGRPIDARDDASRPRVAVVSERFARHYFGRASALGRQFDLLTPESVQSFEIVGVAGDVRDRSLRTPGTRLVYIPQFQSRDVPPYFDFALRTAGNPSSWIAMVRQEIQRRRPDAPVLAIRTLADQINRHLLSERLLATLCGFFAVVALTLAAVGLYGLLAYVIARRVPEIGIRMALGARPRTLLWRTLRESVVLGALGTLVGLGAAVVALRGVQSLLFGLSPTDVGSLIGAALLLIGIALVAGFVPARRAAAVDPAVALRAE
ncbi:MAG: FtsX-like permease family protein [Luteitalea sp.]|nr:FtsX-like permease family protein [Luteitalea sp.]